MLLHTCVKGVGPVWCLLRRSPRPTAYSHWLWIWGSSFPKGFSTCWLYRGMSAVETVFG